MKLILLRHAKSDWSDPEQEDRDRSLNARGQAAAAKIGGWLASRGHLPDLVLCSDAARTRQTFEALALPACDTSFRPDLYLAGSDVILALAKAQTAACVLIVAHNPGIAEAAAKAVETPPAEPDFARYPTGACTVVDLTAGLPGRFLDFTTPRDP